MTQSGFITTLTKHLAEPSPGLMIKNQTMHAHREMFEIINTFLDNIYITHSLVSAREKCTRFYIHSLFVNWNIKYYEKKGDEKYHPCCRIHQSTIQLSPESRFLLLFSASSQTKSLNKATASLITSSSSISSSPSSLSPIHTLFSYFISLCLFYFLSNTIFLLLLNMWYFLPIALCKNCFFCWSCEVVNMCTYK